MRNFLVLVFAVFLFPVSIAHAGVPQSELDEYGRGIIQNYEDLSQGEDIEWLWIAPGMTLSEFRLTAGEVENFTLLVDDDMDVILEDGFQKVLRRVESRDESAPVLNVSAAVYWAERANRAKAWIPYAGMHLAQAGVGLELVFKDADGNIVAKIRHSGREGKELKDATQELVDDIAKFIHAGVA